MSKPYVILPSIKRETILSLLKQGKRIDGRNFDEYRPIKVETGLAGKAEGSSLVSIGDTKVIAGVKVEVGTPFPDTPDMGVQIVNAELMPIASPIFEPGPPGEDDVELARVIDRGLRSSSIIKLEELAIIPGKKVWTVFIDIYTLDHDGNLFDAAGLAAIAALLTTKMKKVKVENEEITVLDETVHLPIGTVPVFVTIAKIGGALLLDPSFEEELVMDARITFAVGEDGNIYGIQKGGSGGFTREEILKARDMALDAAKMLHKLLPPKPQSVT